MTPLRTGAVIETIVLLNMLRKEGVSPELIALTKGILEKGEPTRDEVGHMENQIASLRESLEKAERLIKAQAAILGKSRWKERTEFTEKTQAIAKRLATQVRSLERLVEANLDE